MAYYMVDCMTRGCTLKRYVSANTESDARTQLAARFPYDTVSIAAVSAIDEAAVPASEKASDGTVKQYNDGTTALSTAY